MGISLWTASGIDPADFSRFEPVPPEGIARATALMQSGEMFRYCNGDAGPSEAVLFERELADYVGAKYALGVNSCSKAIEIALTVLGVGEGTRILLPAFTFSAVPSAIIVLGAIPVFVESTPDYRIDLDDLRAKITPQTRILLLSHMRGHAPDMDEVMQICADYNVTLVEDAAHALGGRWRGKAVGSFGRIGCYSFQSNKIINAGEGGMLVTDDEELIVKAILLSGAYESNFQKHGLQSAFFEKYQSKLPLHNARMTNITAAIARPQVPLIDAKGQRYRAMYAYLRKELAELNIIEFAIENSQELRIPDSLQFRLQGFDSSRMQIFLARVRANGIPITGFAESNNARAYYNWRYLDVPELPRTKALLANACDLRLSSTLSNVHLSYLASAIRSAVGDAQAG